MIKVKEKYIKYNMTRHNNNYSFKEIIEYKKDKKEFDIKVNNMKHYEHVLNEKKRLFKVRKKQKVYANKYKSESLCTLQRIMQGSSFHFYFELKLKKQGEIKNISNIKYIDYNGRLKDNGIYICLEDFKGRDVIEELKESEVIFELEHHYRENQDKILESLGYDSYKYIQENDIIIDLEASFLSNKIIFIKNYDYYQLMNY